MASTQAESEFFKSFKDNYDHLGSDLANKPPAELAEISDFVYEKDVATFTFQQGKLYLLRHLDGRPTTAIFLGEGHAQIEVPSPVERQSLMYAAKDSVIDETFQMAFINFSDDFDLRLREQFTFKEAVLGWRDFNKSQQGEFFFKPVVMHEYDNYFQLLCSHYGRKEDGFFWIDFNRYTFCYDPNRAEEVVVGYEHEGGDQECTHGAIMQRREKGIYDDYRMSDIAFPSTILSRQGELLMTGLDGKYIERAAIDLSVQIDRDSLRFVSVYLHHNLNVDSVYYDGAPADFWRRGDFAFMGVILPEYRYRGDTVNIRLVYHGKDYQMPLPFVENPKPSEHNLIFDIPSGYNYIIPAMARAESQNGKHDRYTVTPQEPYRMFEFQPYASGFDTIPLVSDIGITLSFLKSKHITKGRYDCFVPDEYYRNTTAEVFNYLTGRLGMPPATFAVWVYPEMGRSMPGLMGVPQVQCLVDGTGGLYMTAGNSAARQWFGSLMRPRTDREYWLLGAVPDYLSLMCVSSGVSPSVFFGELKRRRNQIYTIVENDNDKPLAGGRRLTAVHRMVKGDWVLHMLRYLLYDLENPSDRPFLRFLNELKVLCNNSLFTNEDVIKLAEKHYGQPLDWFFKHWLYSRNIPEYDVKLKREQRAAGQYVVADVTTKKVGPDFKMPVIIRVESEEGQSTYHRQMIAAGQDHFELGPFPSRPKDVIFNEFFSVLSKDHVDLD
jgi:hypothetical protein